MIHLIPFAELSTTELKQKASDKTVLVILERGCQRYGFALTYFHTGRNSVILVELRKTCMNQPM